MVIPLSRSFAAGLVVTGLASTAAWLILRQSTDRLNHKSVAELPTAITPPPPRIHSPDVGPAHRAERLWRALAPGDFPSVRHWAVFDAVPDAEVPAWARRLGSDPDHSLRRFILQRWAALDGAAAMAWLESNGQADAPSTSETGPDLAGSMLACWIAADPAGGAAGLRRYLASLPPDRALPVSAMESLAARDLTATLETVAGMLTPHTATPPGRFHQLDHTARLLAAQARDPANREMLKAWLHRHPDPSVRGCLFAWIYRHFDPSLGGPARLREYLPGSDALPDDVRHPDAIWAILPYTELTDPVAAFSAHRQLMAKDNSSARNHLVQAMRSWAGSDPESAGLWLAAQPPSPLIDQARRAYAERVIDDDPAAALDWAGAIADPGWRSLVCGNLYRHWRRSDPAAAEAWLATAPLNTTQRQYVAGRAKRDGY